VAFEKKPAPGFYDTGAENAMTKDMQQEFRPTTVEEMEGKRRKVGCCLAYAPHVITAAAALHTRVGTGLLPLLYAGLCCALHCCAALWILGRMYVSWLYES
jgi:hypothetical protein